MSEGFDKKQQRELDEARTDGLSEDEIDVMRRTDLDADQLHELRLAFKMGLTAAQVQELANSGLDWEEMAVYREDLHTGKQDRQKKTETDTSMKRILLLCSDQVAEEAELSKKGIVTICTDTKYYKCCLYLQNLDEVIIDSSYVDDPYTLYCMIRQVEVLFPLNGIHLHLDRIKDRDVCRYLLELLSVFHNIFLIDSINDHQEGKSIQTVLEEGQDWQRKGWKRRKHRRKMILKFHHRKQWQGKRWILICCIVIFTTFFIVIYSSYIQDALDEMMYEVHEFNYDKELQFAAGTVQPVTDMKWKDGKGSITIDIVSKETENWTFYLYRSDGTPISFQQQKEQGNAYMRHTVTFHTEKFDYLVLQVVHEDDLSRIELDHKHFKKAEV